MDKENLYTILEFSDSEQQQLNSVYIADEVKYKILFYSDEDAFFLKLDEEYPNDYLVTLYLFLQYALQLYNDYLKFQISERIYFDTINDFKVWINDCKKKEKCFGLKERYWLNEHLHMRLFKLGRLQFQKVIYSKNLFDFINDDRLFLGKYIYFVHIPEGESLSEGAVEESFKMACQFYHCHHLDLFCESWLLSPELFFILDKESNILKFSQRFEIISVNHNSKSIYKYLHNDSRLFHLVVDYENNHRPIGVATGYLGYDWRG